MRHRTALALLFVVGIASPAAANFLGSAIRLEVAHPTVSTLISTPTTATVTSAVEFPNVRDFGLAGTNLAPTAIDISGTSITIDFDNLPFAFVYSGGVFNGYIFTDVNDSLPDFAAVTIDTSVTTLGLTPARVTATANQIFINVSGLSFTPATFAKIDVAFGTSPQPSAPSNLQATVAGNVLTLNWVSPTTVPSAYLIEAGSGPGLTDIASVAVPATPGLTTPVPNGTYFIRVRAVFPNGPGPASNEVVAVVGCAGPPAPPTGFTVAQGPGGNPVHFSWAASSSAVTAYRLEAGSAPGLANLAAINLAASATVFDVQAPPGAYYVRLRALNACGASAPSSELLVTVGASCIAPTAPTLTASVNAGLVSLSWTAPATGTTPVTYTLLAGSTPGASNLAIAPMGAATSLQTPVPNGTYFVRVAASNACGTSVSNEATVVVGLAGGAPQLTFTITPNPVPFTGVFAGCAGSTTAQKTWVYTLRITNQGTGPFTIGSFTGLVTPPGSAPVVVTHPASTFALAFGGPSIAPQASREGPLCVWGNWEDATLQWTFTDVGGAAFTAPAITFLRP